MTAKLTVVIPARNEEEVIENTLHDLERRLRLEHKIIVVNDRSADRTEEIVRGLRDQYPNIEIINNPYPGGFTNALKAGFEKVDTEFVVAYMADACDDPLTIERMYEKVLGGFDVVCGSRYMPGGKKNGGRFLQTLFSKFVGLSLRSLINLPTHDATNAFKMYRTGVINSINIEEAGFAVSLEIIVKAYLRNYKITEVPTTWKDRTGGRSNFRLFKVARNYIRWYIWAILLRNHKF